MPWSAERRTYDLLDARLAARVELAPSGVRANVEMLAFRLAAEGWPIVHASTVLDYDESPPGHVEIGRITLATDASRIELTGGVRRLDSPELDVTLGIGRLAPSDVAVVVPSVRLQQDVSGKIRLVGPKSSLKATLELAAAGARLTAEVVADVAAEPPRFDGTARMERLDLGKLVAGGTLAGVVDASLRARGRGMKLAAMKAEGALDIAALRFQTWELGDVAVAASVADGRGELHGEVTRRAGRAKLDGEVGLAGGEHYRVALAVDHLDLRKIAPGRVPAAGDLNLRGTAVGSKFTLAEATSRIDVRLLPSRLGALKLDRGRVAVSVAGGKATLAEVSLASAKTRLLVAGDVGLVGDQRGELSYALLAGDLAPWLALASQEGAGSLALNGRVAGALGRLAARGSLRGASLRLGTATVDRARADFDVRGIGDAHPSGRLAARADGVAAGVRLKSVSLDARLPPESAARAEITLDVTDAENRHDRAVTALRVGGDSIDAVLRELTLELPDGAWRLPHPVAIAPRGRTVRIDHFVVANGEKRVSVNGTAGMAGGQDLVVAIDSFPLAALRGFAPPGVDVQGILGARVALGGTAAAPELDATAKLAKLAVAGQAYDGLDARFGYRKGVATAELTFRQDASHALAATAKLPLEVAWEPALRAQISGDVDARARSSGLSLAFLNALGRGSIAEVAGTLAVDVSVRGPLSRPQPNGTIELWGGAGKLVALGVQVSSLEMQTLLTPTSIVVTRLAATSGDGRLDATANVTLGEAGITDVTTSLAATKWPAIRTTSEQADVEGRLRTHGPLSALQASGRIDVLRAVLKPDLAILTSAPPARDDTIVVLASAASPAPPPPAAGKQPPPAASLDTYKNMSLDVAVAIHRDTWIKQDDAAVELEGQVRATKAAGGDLALAGTVHTVRGWAVFQSRRFTLTRGSVTFTGDMNPALDVTARYKVPSYVVRIVIGGTANQPTLTLRSDPELEPADVLSVLLFGKPSRQLSEGQQTTLQRRAGDIATSFAGAQVGQSVAQALGLESLGVQVEEVSASRVALGTYVTDKTFVSVSQSFRSRDGQQASVDYELWPNWDVTGSTTSTGNNGIDLSRHKRY